MKLFSALIGQLMAVETLYINFRIFLNINRSLFVNCKSDSVLTGSFFSNTTKFNLFSGFFF